MIPIRIQRDVAIMTKINLYADTHIDVLIMLKINLYADTHIDVLIMIKSIFTRILI